MGLWKKGINRSRTGEHRTEEIGTAISSLHKLKDFITEFLSLKRAYIYPVSCELEIEGRISKWRIHTDMTCYELEMEFSPNDFEYSVFMFFRQQLGELNYINSKSRDTIDNQMEQLLAAMSNNLSNYLHYSFTNSSDYSVLYNIK